MSHGRDLDFMPVSTTCWIRQMPVLTASTVYRMSECSQEPDDLFETISQALMNAFDRDAVSGWGGVVYIIEKDKVTKKLLKTRMD